MKMKTASKAYLTVSLLVASSLLIPLALSSCDNDIGILAGIQEEKEQSGSDLYLNTMVTKALSFNGSIYASSARIYSRPSSGGDWSQVNVGGFSSYTVLSMATDGTRLYAAILDEDGSNAVHAYDGGAWTALPLPTGIGSYTIDALFSAGTEIYAQAHIVDSEEASTYSLYRINGTSFAGSVTNLGALGSPFTGTALRVGSEYWFATQTTIYQGNATSASETTGVLTGSDPKINGIMADGVGLLYIATMDGTLYVYDGSSWSNGEPGGDDEIGLGAMARVNYGSGDKLLVGMDTDDSATDADGYYEGSLGGSVVGGWSFVDGEDGIITATDSIYSTTIAGKPVRCFLWDSASSTLLACVAPGASDGYYGLYSTKFASGAWSGWTAE